VNLIVSSIFGNQNISGCAEGTGAVEVMKISNEPVIFATDYADLFESLMDQYCLPRGSMVFVEDIVSWCRGKGIPEPDGERPVRLVSVGPGECKMLIRKHIPERTVSHRINAVGIRNQRQDNRSDIAGRLNSDKKRLAFLFLSEYASSLPEIGDEELLADAWAFKEMERMRFFEE